MDLLSLLTNMGEHLVGSRAPELGLKELDGGEITLAGLEGTPTVLSFWFLACETCREELPHLQALRDQFSPADLEIIAVNAQDPADAIRTALEEGGYTFRVALDGEASGAARRYDVRCYPATFVLDRGLTITTVIVGSDPERLRAAVAAIT
jgi:peroxiredoxin